VANDPKSLLFNVDLDLIDLKLPSIPEAPDCVFLNVPSFNTYYGFCFENQQQAKLWQITAWQLDYCRNNHVFPVFN
jgi:hypothetical protein